MRSSTPTPLSPEERERWAQVGVLAALAMVLGYLETFIPIPLPGVKLGLANIAVLIALARHDTTGAFCVAALKVLAAGFLFGNPITMAYSAVGTLLAFAVMALLSQVRGLSIVLVSIVGALAHEAGQLAVAMVLLGTPLVWYSAPVLAIAGCITGFLCGAATSHVLGQKNNDTAHTTGSDAEVGEIAQPIHRAENGHTRDVPLEHALQRENDGPRRGLSVNPKVALVIFLVFTLVVLHAQSIPVLLVLLAIAAAAGIAGRVRGALLVKALRPLLLILIITFIAQVASLQAGDVLFWLGPIAITQQALQQTLIMVLRLLALMLGSIAVMQLASLGGLVDAIGWLVSPLARLGVRIDGFMLALEVALATVPSLLAAIQQEQWSWRTWRTAVPAFIARYV